MNRTIRAIIAVIFIGVIMVSAISICHNLGRDWRADVTDQKIYTLSDGTKAVLGKLNQPIKLKLYYAATAATKAPDQIRFFNNYYSFVHDLLTEYEKAGMGNVKLEVIDPRPFSDNESDALRYGLKKFPVTQEENFFFGLTVQTQFGVTKTIPFFTPDRQNFVEYDISYLIDTAIQREKKRIGVLSSLPVTGDDVSGYMAQMMQMQGQQPKPAWGFVDLLKDQYEVSKVEADADKIEDIDLLLVVHPKGLSEQTQLAIDQFVLGGGRTVVMVDPHCLADQPDPQGRMQGQMPESNSSLDTLLQAWGLTMPEMTFAGDRSMSVYAQTNPNASPEKIIGYLNVTNEGMSHDEAMTADLNSVRVLFSGVLKAEAKDGVQMIPLLSTTNRGNSFKIDSPYELMGLNPKMLMDKFSDGSEPVNMAYMVTGKLSTAFPEGIDVEVKAEEGAEPESEGKSAAAKTEHVNPEITEGADCAVVVFADVDFISDMLAFQNTFFGKATAGDNSALLVNAIEEMSGSSDLIAIRSRGNFQRPFDLVDEIERKAEEKTQEKVSKLQAAIEGFQNELNELVQKAGAQALREPATIEKQRQLELKIRDAQREERQIQNRQREDIEQLGSFLRNVNMLAAPAVILLAAIVLALRRGTRRRRYISHSSDA